MAIDTSLKLLNSDKLLYDQLTVFSDSCYHSQHYNYYFGDDSICENYSFNFIGDSLAEIQINILLSSITKHRFILNDTIDLLKEKNYDNFSHNLVQVRETTIHNQDYRVYNIKAKRFENYNCWYKFNCN